MDRQKSKAQVWQDDESNKIEQIFEDNNIPDVSKEVLDEVCKDDVEVEGNQLKDSKEDAKNKKCWLISNDIVKGGKGSKKSNDWYENQTAKAKDKSKINNEYVMCRNRRILEVVWKPMTLGKLVLLYQPNVHLREFLTSSLSVIAGKDLETKNGSSRASLLAMKTMLENVIGSVKRIRGDKEDCILESQDKKVDNDVKEIRKISCLSNLIFGDDDMNLSFHQNISSDYVVMGVNEFVGGANRSERNLVLRSNSRFLADEYERNIFEVKDKRGIGADACKFAISILNCIDQYVLISSEMHTLVLVWNLGTGEKVHTLKGRKMQATCVTLDGSDVVSISIDCTITRWKGDDRVYYFK
nr:phospholipase A2-activating protein [Tanacetum cinerariifolium]